VHLKHSPEAYLDRFLYDTILHSKTTLEFLIASVGAGPRVSRQRLSLRYGHDGLRASRPSLNITADDRDAILGGHAAAI